MTADGFLGDLQDLGRFGVGQANKIVQLHDFGANRILHRQLLQSLVDQQYFLVIRASGDLEVVHVQPLLSAAVFGAAFAAGAVHQDVPQRFWARGWRGPLSTRMSRIVSPAAAKKWLRPFPSCRSEPTSRSQASC